MRAWLQLADVESHWESPLPSLCVMLPGEAHNDAVDFQSALTSVLYLLTAGCLSLHLFSLSVSLFHRPPPFTLHIYKIYWCFGDIFRVKSSEVHHNTCNPVPDNSTNVCLSTLSDWGMQISHIYHLTNLTLGMCSAISLRKSSAYNIHTSLGPALLSSQWGLGGEESVCSWTGLLLKL